jgi:hypothetical protein
MTRSAQSVLTWGLYLIALAVVASQYVGSLAILCGFPDPSHVPWQFVSLPVGALGFYYVAAAINEGVWFFAVSVATRLTFSIALAFFVCFEPGVSPWLALLLVPSLIGSLWTLVALVRPGPSGGGIGDAARYHFVTNWSVEGRADEVHAILMDMNDYVRWWSATYKEVTRLPGEVPTFTSITTGWLPYKLNLKYEIVDVQRPLSWGVVVSGDLVGRGQWTLQERDGNVLLLFDWSVEANKPILRFGAPFCRPFFASNHRWAMSMGERGLRRAIARLGSDESTWCKATQT